MRDQPSHPLVLDDSPAKQPSSAPPNTRPLPTSITTLFPRPCVCRILSHPSALLHASLAFFFSPSSHSLTLAVLRRGLAMWPRLASDSRFSHLILLSAGIMDPHHHACFSFTLSPSLSYLYCLYSGHLPGQETPEWSVLGPVSPAHRFNVFGI